MSEVGPGRYQSSDRKTSTPGSLICATSSTIRGRYEFEHAASERLVRQLRAAMNGPGRIQRVLRAVGARSGGSGPVAVRSSWISSARPRLQINRDLSALEEANERVASGAGDQSEAVSRTATSVEALSDRIDRIAHNAGEAAEACERARQEAHQGLEQVHNVIEGMDRLLTRIEANGRKVRRLEDRSTEIGVIVELIRRHLQPHRHARPQRHDRIDPRRGTWPRLRGRRRGDP